MIETVADNDELAAEGVAVIEELLDLACALTPLSQKGNCKKNKVEVFMAMLAQ